MSVTFFALTSTGDIVDTNTDIRVSNANGAHIMRALGLTLDPADHPAGEMPLRAMADAIRAARPTALGSMVRYLAYLDQLIFEARDNGASVISWA